MENQKETKELEFSTKNIIFFRYNLGSSETIR